MVFWCFFFFLVLIASSKHCISCVNSLCFFDHITKNIFQQWSSKIVILHIEIKGHRPQKRNESVSSYTILLFIVSLGTVTPSSSTPIEFCKNGGTWQNGRCICPEEWEGWRCTISKLLGIILGCEI